MIDQMARGKINIDTDWTNIPNLSTELVALLNLKCCVFNIAPPRTVFKVSFLQISRWRLQAHSAVTLSVPASRTNHSLGRSED